MRITFQPQDWEAIFATCLQEAKAIVTSYRAEAPMGFDPRNETGIGGTGYDPTYDFEMPPTGYVIMGLAALSAFAAIGVGAFFTYAAVEVGEALTVTYTVAPTGGIGGLMAYAAGSALTEGQIVILSQMEALAINAEMGGGVLTALTLCAETWAMEAFTIEGLIALAAVNVSVPPNPRHYGNMGGYMGHFGNNFGGGSTTPPGFPGFPAVTVYGGHNIGFMVCYKIEDEVTCFFQY